MAGVLSNLSLIGSHTGHAEFLMCCGCTPAINTYTATERFNQARDLDILLNRRLCKEKALNSIISRNSLWEVVLVRWSAAFILQQAVLILGLVEMSPARHGTARHGREELETDVDAVDFSEPAIVISCDGCRFLIACFVWFVVVIDI